MALIKRILLFFASIVFTIVLLIGATTSYGKDEFEVDANEENRRFFTMEWIDAVDDNNRKFACGTKVSTFDITGRKLVLEYYYIITNENKIVTRFDVNVVQASVLALEPLETEEFRINLHGAIIKKDNKDLLAGLQSRDKSYKGVGAEFTELDIIGNTKLFKILYYGDYEVELYFIPGAPKIVPIAKNKIYVEGNEETLIRCIMDLLDNQEEKNTPKGEVFIENAYRTV